MEMVENGTQVWFVDEKAVSEWIDLRQTFDSMGRSLGLGTGSN